MFYLSALLCTLDFFVCHAYLDYLPGLPLFLHFSGPEHPRSMLTPWWMLATRMLRPAVCSLCLIGLLYLEGVAWDR